MSCQTVAPVFLQYEDALKGFILKQVKDPQQTKDILHEVLLKVHTHCEKLPEVRNIKAWLYQITRNAVYDYFRAAGKQVALETDIADEHEDIFQKQILECVRPLIGLLPETYSQPLILSDLEEKPQQEVANMLGLSLTATKSRIQRARQKLRELFFECCHLELDHAGRLVSMEIKDDCTSLRHLRSEKISCQGAAT